LWFKHAWWREVGPICTVALASPARSLAVAVVGASLLTTLRVPHRVATRQLPVPLDKAADVTVNDLATLAFFSTMITIALALRRRPEVHRRLMGFASMAIISPAWGRLGDLLYQWTGSPALVIPFNLLFLIGLPFSLLVHDLRTTRRLHPATAWGLAAFLVVVVFGGHILSASPMGRALFKALE
jgi:hypothetical protein